MQRGSRRVSVNPGSLERSSPPRLTPHHYHGTRGVHGKAGVGDVRRGYFPGRASFQVPRGLLPESAAVHMSVRGTRMYDASHGQVRRGWFSCIFSQVS